MLSKRGNWLNMTLYMMKWHYFKLSMEFFTQYVSN